MGVALHAGHQIRGDLMPQLALSESTRLREEDPYTDYWTQACPTRLLVSPSRFQVDLNRPLEEAVYRTPEDSWGLRVWRGPLNRQMIRKSRAEYRNFYRATERVMEKLRQRYGHFVAFDLHSYNYRRDGPDSQPADPVLNPEVNIGTGTMDRTFWGPLVERFIDELRAFDFLGRHLDIRENVRFRGRQFPQFVHEHFPRIGCVLAIEVKKFFMDEWSGTVDMKQLEAMLRALKSTVPSILEELERM